MNWIEIAWPMMAGGNLMLALVHILISFKQGYRLANLAFGIACISVAVLAIFELLLMNSRTPDEYADLLRWAHVPLAAMMIGMVAFVHLHLHAGRLWLGLLVCIGRLISLIPNFTTGVNLNFREITALHFWTSSDGGMIASPIGTLNPWMALGELTVVLLLVYLIDAAISARHRPVAERARILPICVSMALFMLASSAWTVASINGFHLPLVIIPMFMGVLLVMSFALSHDFLQAAQLAKNLTDTEASLRDSKQRIDLAVRGARIGLWSRELVRNDVWLSDVAMRILGFGPNEKFERANVLARIHEEDRALLDLSTAGAIAGDGTFKVEYRLTLPQGGMRWIESHAQVDFNESRQPVRINGVVLDITERKEAAERFRLVFEASPNALLMVGPDGRITLANRQAEVVFGYSRVELAGMTVDALTPARSRLWHANERAIYANSSRSRAMGMGRELSALRKDGVEISVEIALSPIQFDAGAFVLASIVDITERKRADRELAVQRDELAHLSRVVMLAELSGSLAHELNQPLTAILSNAQAAVRYMAHTPPNLDEVRESLSNIVENDKRAGEVIRRLRAMLRKERADQRRLDINDIVVDVLRIIRSDLLNRNVEITTRLAPALPSVNGDQVQLQQVLLNLVMNAADAMSHVAKGREITLSTSLSAEDAIVIAVSDVGRGIPADDLDRIFSPFVTTKTSGMGLGLAVCSSIINAHHGHIWASNNEGHGATVQFSLPALPERQT